jgi:hypothetical protein
VTANLGKANLIARPFGLAAVFLAAFAVLLETSARLPFVEQISPYRSLGNYDYQFEIKWFLLQDFVESQGGVDIILLGSSIANTAVDPDVVAGAIFEQTGLRLRVFNFGLEGMTIAPNSRVARILTEQYHPVLLVYMTEMRDFVAGNGLEVERRFLSDPWIRHRSGDQNLLGWTIDQSAALQHYLPYRDWVRAGFFERMATFTWRYQDTSVTGYEPDLRVAQALNVRPDPRNPEEAPNFEANAGFQVSPSRLRDLLSILELQETEGASILIVEAPAHPSFYVYFGGDEVHRDFQVAVRSLAEEYGSAFVAAESCNQIPDEGRSNRWHLNRVGAPIFSRCLGERLVDFASERKLTWPTAAADPQ